MQVKFIKISGCSGSNCVLTESREKKTKKQMQVKFIEILGCSVNNAVLRAKI